MLTQIVLLVICQTIVADNSVNKPYYDVENGTLIRDLFENFIQTNSRNYDGAEKEERFQIFVETLKEINSLNKEYDATFDVDFFADLRPEERKSYLGLNTAEPFDVLRSSCKIRGNPTTKSAPASWDWRDKKVVTPIKDQGNCGSCYAFATIALVESRLMAKHGKVMSLSEQQVVDCDELSKNCNGGLITTAVTYIMDKGGIETSSSYPYEAKGGMCRFDRQKAVAQVTSCYAHDLKNEEYLKELLYHEGPLAITVAASKWSSYQNGVYENCSDLRVDHAVLLVGYGSENGKDYWIIKNSWGTVFGEKGYIKLRRGVNCNNIMDNTFGTFVSISVA